MLNRLKAIPVLSLFLAHAGFSNGRNERAPASGFLRESGQSAIVSPFSVERTVRSRKVRQYGNLCRHRVYSEWVT